ncbi:uncharacterized protein EAE98_012300 [Botrytis deweyae]|uniref:Uncharacterized protein n=1 Tax=Botrytis deweyae TaxID=2478750 RepID=A0ABQ7I3Q0_9HELO|nr:uncharacterized protein EAE98_012300 [Botrytis deweyae]KAF7909221.1 hypothetical protein EAE98_012300 [Botrytis deweyae]
MGGNYYAYVNVIQKRNDADGIRIIAIDEVYTVELPFQLELMSEELQDDVLFWKHDEVLMELLDSHVAIYTFGLFQWFGLRGFGLLLWNRSRIHRSYCKTEDTIETWMTVSYREVEAVEG